MEIVFLILLPAALWAHAWYLLGFYTNPRTLGLIAAGVAIALLALVVQAPLGMLSIASPAAMSAFILIWAVYALLVAAVGLWGFDERTVGFYSLFLWVMSLIFVGYFFGGELLGGASLISIVMGVSALMLSVLAALLFFYLTPPFTRMRQATGWFFLTGSIIIALLGGLLVLGLPA